MKKNDLIGIYCHTKAMFGPMGIVKDIIKVNLNDQQLYKVIIEDADDKVCETVDLFNVIFEYPMVHLWGFEYLNSSHEINGDEKFHSNNLWLDTKISKDEVTRMITAKYRDSNKEYFALRNLEIKDTFTRDLSFNFKSWNAMKNSFRGGLEARDDA